MKLASSRILTMTFTLLLVASGWFLDSESAHGDLDENLSDGPSASGSASKGGGGASQESAPVTTPPGGQDTDGNSKQTVVDKKESNSQRSTQSPDRRVRKPAAPLPAGKRKSDESLVSKKQNEKAPVEFESSGLKGTRREGILQLNKDVVVKQGDLRIEADRADVFFDQESEEVDHVVASGNVQIFKTDPKSGEKVKASGETVTFEAEKNLVTLSGNAKFSRGKDLVRGKIITYDLKSGWLSGEKIDGVVQPGAEKKVNH